MPPTLANGKICYIELPATDVTRSSDFYKRIFGWNIRTRGDGSTSFDDTTGQVSGTWVLGRPPAAKPGLLFYIMVDSVAATLDASSPMDVKLSSRSEPTRPKSLRDSAIREEM
jgi:predicted enzyme related to lactoylglutathione lyase